MPEIRDETADTFRRTASPALDGAIGTRWVNLLMAVQEQWIKHEAEREAGSGPCPCQPCRVYRTDWWD